MTTATIPALSGGVHPAAAVFPMLEGAEFDALAESIREQGLLEPIWLLPNGDLLDGRNRLSACRTAGVEPEFRVYDGDDPVRFVVGANLRRRHMNESQRDVVAARLATTSTNPAEASQQRDYSQSGVQICRPLVTVSEAAEMMNVGERGVRTARKVIAEAPDLVPAIEAGDIAVSAAATVLREAPDLLPEVAAGTITATEAVQEAKARVHVANNSGENEWYTPTAYIEAARTAMGSIDVDPATSELAQANVKAATHYTQDDDGLAQEWHGNVWMNPPYAQPLYSQFIAKLAEEVEAGNVTQACVLVNNGTETAAGQQLLELAAAVCFVRGRIKFLDKTGVPSGAPLQGQMVAYIGDDVDDFAMAHAEIGVVLHG